MSESNLARLEIAADKLEIQEVIYNLARSVDRCDADLMKSCFHTGATDDHGQFVGTAEDFVVWVMPILETMEQTQHCICNILIKLEDDKATTESYFLAFHTLDIEGSSSHMVAAGRYLDTLEKRDGVWKITHRQAVFDWNQLEPSSDTWGQPPAIDQLLRGVRNSSDASYKNV